MYVGKKSVIEVGLHSETSAIHSNAINDGASTSSSVSNTETVTTDKVPNNKIDQPIKKINKQLAYCKWIVSLALLVHKMHNTQLMQR